MIKVLFSVDLASEKLPPFRSLLQLMRAVNSPYLIGHPLSTRFTCFFYPCNSDTENLHCSYINTFLSTSLLVSILCFIVCKFSHMCFGFSHSFIHLLTWYILIELLLRAMHCTQPGYKKADVRPYLDWRLGRRQEVKNSTLYLPIKFVIYSVTTESENSLTKFLLFSNSWNF